MRASNEDRREAIEGWKSVAVPDWVPHYSEMEIKQTEESQVQVSLSNEWVGTPKGAIREGMCHTTVEQALSICVSTGGVGAVRMGTQGDTEWRTRVTGQKCYRWQRTKQREATICLAKLFV